MFSLVRHYLKLIHCMYTEYEKPKISVTATQSRNVARI